MLTKAADLLQLQCGFSAEIAEHDGMLWLFQNGTNVSAGLSLNQTSEISFDESSGEAFFSTLAFMTLPVTKSQAEALAKMLSASFHVYEQLDTEEEVEIYRMVDRDLELLDIDTMHESVVVPCSTPCQPKDEFVASTAGLGVRHESTAL